MSSSPFVDRHEGTVKVGQLLAEAIPLAKLVGVVVAAALVPFGLRLLVTSSFSPLGILLTLAAQFVLAVGGGLVLMYVVARGIHLAEA